MKIPSKSDIDVEIYEAAFMPFVFGLFIIACIGLYLSV